MDKKLDIKPYYDNELKQSVGELQTGVAIPPTKRPPPSNTPFLTQLYIARRQAQLTQVQLAQAVGISQSSLARIEMGKGNPTLKTLLKLASVLKVELRLQRQEQ